MKAGRLTARECCARAFKLDGASRPPTVVGPEPLPLDDPLMRLKLEVLLCDVCEWCGCDVGFRSAP